uniref:Rod_C domain-containing protein n=1 Tax=Globodera pallida TaxID=36090 RepID=A0A183CCW1_GLOPA
MSSNLLPTIELKLCDDTLTKSAQEFVKQQQSSKIVDHAQIVCENFFLVLLLTSNEDLIVHYRIGASSRFTSFSIRSLFSEKSFSQLALTAIAFDCSVVVFISSDGQTILLVPFRAFMDVTWGQKSTLSVVNPTTPPQFCLEFFATDNIRQVLCMPRMVVVLTLQNDLFIHLRVFQPAGTSVRYEPTKAILTSNAPLEADAKILHLIPSASANANRSGEEPLECFSIVTETGLFTVRTQKSLNDFVLDHLSSKFYSTDCLSTVADFLQISPLKLCLSLLRWSLRIPSAVDVPQVDSIISLAFKCKIEPSALLSVLQESSREDLLLPFLRVKIEKDSGDKSLRQLLLGALLARIAHISEDDTKLEENGHRKELEVEKDALEYELRNFLIKFDVNEPEVLLVLLRYSLLSCVCVLLCRNASVHSPTVVRFLLEWPDWKSIKLVGSLLKCLSYMHWPSIDSYSRTVVAKLFNLVPFFDIIQLQMVDRIAKLLIERSIDCAHSLQLVCLLRLFHFAKEKEEQLKSVPIPTAWDFDRFSGASGEQCSTLARGNAIQSTRTKDAKESAADTFPARKRLPRGKERAGPFVHTSIPQAVKLPDSRLEIRAVSCGTEHVLLLTVVGRLFSWGLNRYGQCGDGTEKPIVSPIEIKGKWGSIVSICAGHYHSGFVSESGEIYLWGWGLYGQLGNGGIADLRRPTKSRPFTALGCVKTICLGYSHTLALCFDGRVFGCGALSHGQLGVDPRHLEGNPIKATNPIQLPFPMPISLLASKYFHGIALGVDETKKGVLFEWGDSPQSLKMKTFLQRRLRSKQKKAKGKTGEHEHPSMAESAQIADVLGEPVTSMVNVQPVHLRIRKLCEWDDGSVKALSAGFNHSALLTVDGELFTWGKSLEMQLGHLNRKEKVQPTKVEVPQGVRWFEVVCARNFTTAVSVEGKIFVWGRNDKLQLGLGPTALKAPGQIRKIALKSDKGTAQRSVELPVDNSVETPSIVPGLRAFTERTEQTIPNEAQLSEVFSNANQLALNTLSRFLLKHPLLNFMAVQAHLMSGDLLAALRLLVSLVKRDGLLSDSTSTLSQSNWTERPVTLIAQANALKESPAPQRLVEPFLTILSPSDHIGAGLGPSLRVRLTEIGIRERAVRLRQAKVSELEKTQFRALKARCDKLLAQDRFRTCSSAFFVFYLGGGSFLIVDILRNA